MTIIEQIQKFLKPFIGKYLWYSQKGHGSFLTFNLGAPYIEVHEPIQYPNNNYKGRPVAIKGEHFIWVYCSNWKITLAEQEIAHNESTDKEIINAVNFLDGQNN